MNDEDEEIPRLIVGISRSQASWWALDWAIGEARRRGAHLLLAHVFRDADRAAKGNALVWTAIGHAVGRMPSDVPWQEVNIPGRPAEELAALARDTDLLVFGSRRRGRLRRLAPGSMARRCARRARCPVMIVPEPSPRALLASLSGPAHAHWFRRVPRLPAGTGRTARPASRFRVPG